MGKIFDALEKSNRNKTVEANIAVKPKKIHKKMKPQKNVVPLKNSDREISKSNLDASMVVFHKPHSVEAEIFKALRADILFPSSGVPPKTILITSALPDEGKSFLCSNLAISIALGVEEKVVLIDGDIRRPTIHKIFGLGNVQGLSEYLSSGDTIAKYLAKTIVKKLRILPAGGTPSNPSELMASKKMKIMLEEMKSRYQDRYVIIDSPPPAMAPETNVIANYVDGIILVVRAGKTPRAAVANLIEKVGKKKLIGVVLNRADQSSKKYYGYSKSYYEE